jgi:hypothetical protein
MAFVGVSLTVGTAVGLSGTAAIIGGGALIGAGVGGLYSAVTGDGDILNSMLTGGLLGGAGAFGLNAMGVGAGATTAAEAATAAGATGAGTIGPAATTVATTTPAMEAAALLDAAAVAEGGAQAGMAAQYAAQEAAKTAAIQKTAALTGNQMLGYGLAGTAGMQLLGGRNPKGAIAPASATDPGNIRPYEFSPNQMASGDFPSPYATAQYNAAGIPIMDTRERNYFDQKYTAQTPYSARSGTPNPNVPLPTSLIANAANGGIMRNYDDELGKDETSLEQGNMQKGLFGLGYAHGGAANLGDYSDGGRLLRGPGDGVSDSIPATIAGKQPARLADGEFVIPARIVSEIGNGSTDAGAKRLYAMMDRIQSGRKKTVGKGNIAKDTKAKKHLLA